MTKYVGIWQHFRRSSLLCAGCPCCPVVLKHAEAAQRAHSKRLKKHSVEYRCKLLVQGITKGKGEERWPAMQRSLCRVWRVDGIWEDRSGKRKGRQSTPPDSLRCPERRIDGRRDRTERSQLCALVKDYRGRHMCCKSSRCNIVRRW